MQSDIFTGNKVRLTSLQETDLISISKWYDDTEFSRNLDALPATPRTIPQLKEWFEEGHSSANNFIFAIKTIQDQLFIGYIEIDGILWNQGVCGISIAIGKKANQGKGYGYESLQLALKFAFYELNLHRIQLTVFSYNEPAIALYEKLGFQLEGTYREFIYRDGKRYDMYLYGLLIHEWEEINSNNQEE